MRLGRRLRRPSADGGSVAVPAGLAAGSLEVAPAFPAAVPSAFGAPAGALACCAAAAGFASSPCAVLPVAGFSSAPAEPASGGLADSAAPAAGVAWPAPSPPPVPVADSALPLLPGEPPLAAALLPPAGLLALLPPSPPAAAFCADSPPPLADSPAGGCVASCAPAACVSGAAFPSSALVFAGGSGAVVCSGLSRPRLLASAISSSGLGRLSGLADASVGAVLPAGAAASGASATFWALGSDGGTVALAGTGSASGLGSAMRSAMRRAPLRHEATMLLAATTCAAVGCGGLRVCGGRGRSPWRGLSGTARAREPTLRSTWAVALPAMRIDRRAAASTKRHMPRIITSPPRRRLSRADRRVRRDSVGWTALSTIGPTPAPARQYTSRARRLCRATFEYLRPRRAVVPAAFCTPGPVLAGDVAVRAARHRVTPARR